MKELSWSAVEASRRVYPVSVWIYSAHSQKTKTSSKSGTSAGSSTSWTAYQKPTPASARSGTNATLRARMSIGNSSMQDATKKAHKVLKQETLGNIWTYTNPSLLHFLYFFKHLNAITFQLNSVAKNPIFSPFQNKRLRHTKGHGWRNNYQTLKSF